MRERAVQFGPGNVLSGVLHEPSVRQGDLPAVVVSNVGMHTRVGPYRLWVRLARQLAERGYPVLRFDLSGQGDSDARTGSGSDLERAVADTQAAFDLLEKRSIARRFVTIGLCSGVDAVHAASVADPRVVGSVHLDGYAWPTARLKLRRWTVRLFGARVWIHAAERRIARLRAPVKGEGPPTEAIYQRTYPPPHAFAADLRALRGRGVKLLFIWSGGQQHEFNHREQFFDMLEADDLRGHVDVEYFGDCDHVYSTLADRERLLARIGQFLQASFEPSAAAGPAAGSTRTSGP